MRYSDRRLVKLGDIVCLNSTRIGTIVCSIDTGEYSDKYNEIDYAYLDKGVIIEFQNSEIIYLEENFDNLVLLKRGEID